MPFTEEEKAWIAENDNPQYREWVASYDRLCEQDFAKGKRNVQGNSQSHEPIVLTKEERLAFEASKDEEYNKRKLKAMQEWILSNK